MIAVSDGLCPVSGYNIHFHYKAFQS